MNVLSLFDGMSCGRIALRELGIEPEHYYASEIDKFAISQTRLNFPDTIHLGDVTKWREWDIDWGTIDLILAGSPCQGFSFAGKQLAFDDPRSKLFFVFVDILNHVKALNPGVFFLLENVNMKKEHMRVITEYCGVHPVNINSNLVSAQNRNRWYWTNIRTRRDGLFGEIHSDIPLPEDRHILIRDILEEEVDAKYQLSPKALGYVTDEKRLDKYSKIDGDKSMSLQAKGVANNTGTFITAMRGRESACLTTRRTEYGKQIRKDYESGKIKEKRKNIQRLEPREDGKTNALTSVQKDNLLVQLYDHRRKNLRDVDSKANALLASSYKGSGANGMTLVDYPVIRRLTPTECARLQTIPDWYKWGCSETQQYKILGNGWTIKVIQHILSFLKKDINHS